MNNLFSIVVLGWTVFIPMLVSPQPKVQPKQLRTDNIPLSQLDRELRALDLPAHTRALIIDWETKDRQGKKLEPRPADIDQTADGLGLWTPTTCSEGQGCTFYYKCVGTCESQWFENMGGPTAWTTPMQCPTGKLCTVVATIPARVHHHWIMFRAFTGISPVPIYLMSSCFFVA